MPTRIILALMLSLLVFSACAQDEPSLSPDSSGYVNRASGGFPLADVTDDELRVSMIAESIASYPGNCPCPYSLDRSGRQCGGRSAYSRPGGYSPLCYRRDIPKTSVDTYRARYRR